MDVDVPDIVFVFRGRGGGGKDKGERTKAKGFGMKVGSTRKRGGKEKWGKDKGRDRARGCGDFGKDKNHPSLAVGR